MELLATVHWVTTTNTDAADDPDVAVDVVRAWNPRKRATMDARHVHIAWRRLQGADWLRPAAA